MPLKVMSIVGARPQFIKLAPVARALAAAGVEHLVVHTGQHYDQAMSADVFEALGLAEADVNLNIGSGSHGAQTAAMLTALEREIDHHAPQWVIAYGDTNSTLAAALAAVKLHVPLAHLEAGLRSRNREMPEEHNRILTDHAADVCLAPTQLAMRNLSDEGLAQRSVLVGDVMVDVLKTLTLDGQRAAPLPATVEEELQQVDDFVVATIHRAENTDPPGRLEHLLSALAASPFPVVLPVHPRLKARIDAIGLSLQAGAIRPVSPIPYPSLMGLIHRSRAVATDSGGLQKEAFILRRPCVTLRTETEWPETLQGEWNVLASSADDLERLPELLARQPRPLGAEVLPFGDGAAAERVVQVLQRQGVDRLTL